MLITYDTSSLEAKYTITLKEYDIAMDMWAILENSFIALHPLFSNLTEEYLLKLGDIVGDHLYAKYKYYELFTDIYEDISEAIEDIVKEHGETFVNRFIQFTKLNDLDPYDLISKVTSRADNTLRNISLSENDISSSIVSHVSSYSQSESTSGKSKGSTTNTGSKNDTADTSSSQNTKSTEEIDLYELPHQMVNNTDGYLTSKEVHDNSSLANTSNYTTSSTDTKTEEDTSSTSSVDRTLSDDDKRNTSSTNDLKHTSESTNNSDYNSKIRTVDNSLLIEQQEKIMSYIRNIVDEFVFYFEPLFLHIY